jgi:nicotinamide mononucleotide (NMN) deamidase PncC
MQELISVAEKIAARLIERKQTIAVAESSTGGLISAALLSVPGASAYFLGGGVIYTREARRMLMDIPNEAMKTIRSASEPYAKLLASQIRARLATDWGPLRDRRHRPDRQPLWRRRRPQLHGGGRTRGGGDHARDRQQ